MSDIIVADSGIESMTVGEAVVDDDAEFIVDTIARREGNRSLDEYADE